MGLRFRKSFSLGSLLRLNLSKSGVSVGVGPRGLNVNFSPRGLRKTVGLPGTGIYYQETSSWPKTTDAAPSGISGVERSSVGIWIIIALGIVIIVIAINLGGGSTATGSKAAVASGPKVERQPTPPAVNESMPDRPLNREEVRELQTLLRKQGYDAGAPDGIVGPKTQAATQAFARAHRLNDRSEPSLRLLEAVRSYRK